MLVKKKTECPRALRQRVQRSPYLIRRLLNAGRRNSKDRLQTCLLLCGSKGARGKAFPPNGARAKTNNYNTRRGEYGVSRTEAPERKASKKYPQPRHRRGEPPQMAARATFWKIPGCGAGRGGAAPQSPALNCPTRTYTDPTRIAYPLPKKNLCKRLFCPDAGGARRSRAAKPCIKSPQTPRMA